MHEMKNKYILVLLPFVVCFVWFVVWYYVVSDSAICKSYNLFLKKKVECHWFENKSSFRVALPKWLHTHPHRTFLNENRDYAKNKLIHHMDKVPLDKNALKFLSKWQEMYPDYIHLLWDDDDILDIIQPWKDKSVCADKFSKKYRTYRFQQVCYTLEVWRVV